MDGGATAIARKAGPQPGGMDDRPSLRNHGVAYADLLRGNAIHAYSQLGYGYAVEKAGSTKGWSFPIYEEAWNYGFYAEMNHFVACVRDDLPRFAPARMAAPCWKRSSPPTPRLLRARIDLPFQLMRSGPLT